MLNAIELARAEAERHVDSDPTYAELMLTWVELGEATLHGDSPDRVDLIGRIRSLGRVVEREAEARWAAWFAGQQR